MSSRDFAGRLREMERAAEHDGARARFLSVLEVLGSALAALPSSQREKLRAAVLGATDASRALARAEAVCGRPAYEHPEPKGEGSLGEAILGTLRKLADDPPSGQPLDDLVWAADVMLGEARARASLAGPPQELHGGR